MLETWQEKLISIGKGALMAASGAVAAALLDYAGTLDDGTAIGALVAAVISVAVNALRKFTIG